MALCYTLQHITQVLSNNRQHIEGSIYLHTNRGGYIGIFRVRFIGVGYIGSVYMFSRVGFRDTAYSFIGVVSHIRFVGTEDMFDTFCMY